ncbi:MAG: hypothetical protein J0H02_09775 [Armatimonadetes bacterium]|nr:hypothetical protein [Armatimonadota bacterium]
MAFTNGMSWFRRQGAPVTVSIIASMIVTSLIFWLTATKGMEQFVLAPGWQQPWTLLTYPWAFTPFFDGLSLLFFVFLCMWIFFTGGSVERDLGTTKYLVVWLVMILLPALIVSTLGPLTNKGYILAGMWLPEAAITVIWCTRNQTQTIMLYGIVPVAGKWLGWITAATTVLLMGAGNPLMGVIAAPHLPIAWAYAANRIPFWVYSRGGSQFGSRKLRDNPNLKRGERMDKSYYDDVKRREKDREERERLRKLFESSLQDDAGNDK